MSANKFEYFLYMFNLSVNAWILQGEITCQSLLRGRVLRGKNVSLRNFFHILVIFPSALSSMSAFQISFLLKLWNYSLEACDRFFQIYRLWIIFFLDAKIGRQSTVTMVILALKARASHLRLTLGFLTASKQF